MTTIREEATRQRIEREKHYGDAWVEHREFARKIVKQRFGLDCTLIEVDEDEDTQYLVEINDKEFGVIHIRIDKYSNGVYNFYHIFDVYRWKDGRAQVRNSIELLRILSY